MADQLYKIILRHDTSTNWAYNNPVLEYGEYGIEDDSHRVKRGDGSSAWLELSYETFGLEYIVTFENLTGEVTDNETLSEAFNDKMESNAFETVGNKVVSGIAITQGEDTIATITRSTFNVTSNVVSTSDFVITSDDNSINGVWSVNDEGATVIDLSANTVVEEYTVGITYKVNTIVYYENKLLRALTKVTATEEIDYTCWEILGSTTGDGISYNNENTDIEATTVQGAITELDKEKVGKSNEVSIVYGTDEDGNQTTIDRSTLGKVDTVNGVEADEDKNVMITAQDIAWDIDNDKTIVEQVTEDLDTKVDKSIGTTIVTDTEVEVQSGVPTLSFREVYINDHNRTVEENLHFGSEGNVEVKLDNDTLVIDSTTIDNSITALENRSSDIESDVEEFKEKEQADVDNIQSQIDAINEKDIEQDNIIADLTKTVEDNKEELQTNIDNVNSTLTEKIETVETTLDTKIDTVNTELIEKIDDVNSTLSTEIENVNTNLTERIDTEVETLNNNIDTVKSDLENEINTVNTTLTESINSVNSDLTTFKEETTTNFENVETEITELKEKEQTDIDNIQTQIDTINAKDTEQDSRLDTAEAEIDDLQEFQASTTTSLVEINAKNIEQDDRLLATETATTENKESIDTINTTISEIQTEQETQNTNIETNANAISELETKETNDIAAIEAEQQEQDERVDGIDSTIETIQVKDTEQDERLTTIETTVTDNYNELIGDITQINTINDEQSTAIANINTAVSNLNNTTTTLSNNVSSLTETTTTQAEEIATINNTLDTKLDKTFAESQDNKLVTDIKLVELETNQIVNIRETQIDTTDNSISYNNVILKSTDNTITAKAETDESGNVTSIDLETNLDIDVNYFTTSDTLDTTIGAENTLSLDNVTPVTGSTLEVQDIISDNAGTWSRVKSIDTTENTCITITYAKQAQATWGTIKGTLADQSDLQEALNGKIDESTVSKVVTNVNIITPTTESKSISLEKYITDTATGDILELTTTSILTDSSSIETVSGTTQLNVLAEGITFDPLDTGIESIYVASAIRELKTFLDTTNETITTLDTDLSTQIDTLETTLEAEIQAVATSVATLEQTVVDNKKEIEEKVEAVELALNSDISSLADRIETLENDVTTINTNITTINDNIDSVKADITTISTSVTDLETRVQTNETSISTLNTNVSTIDTRLSTAETEIDTLIADVDGLENTKLDKVTDTQVLYGTDENGEQTTIAISSLGKVDTVNGVEPDENKNIVLTSADIYYSDDVMLQTYIDEQLTTVNNSISTLEQTVVDNKTELETSISTLQTNLEQAIEDTKTELQTSIDEKIAYSDVDYIITNINAMSTGTWSGISYRQFNTSTKMEEEQVAYSLEVDNSSIKLSAYTISVDAEGTAFDPLDSGLESTYVSAAIRELANSVNEIETEYTNIETILAKSVLTGYSSTGTIIDTDTVYGIAIQSEALDGSTTSTSGIYLKGENGLSVGVESVTDVGLVFTVDGSELETEIETVSNNLTTLETNIDTELTTIKSDVQTNADNISSNLEEINALKSNLVTIEGNVETNTTNISTIQTQITELQDEDTTLENSISTLETEVDTNTDNIATNTEDIETLKTDVQANTESIETVQTNLDTEVATINETIEEVKETITPFVEYTQGTTYITGQVVYYDREDYITLAARVLVDFTSDTTASTVEASFKLDNTNGNISIIGIPLDWDDETETSVMTDEEYTVAVETAYDILGEEVGTITVENVTEEEYNQLVATASEILGETE